MSRDPPLLVTLELDRGSEPIAGCLDDGAGRRWRFSGWLELTTALTRAIEGPSVFPANAAEEARGNRANWGDRRRDLDNHVPVSGFVGLGGAQLDARPEVTCGCESADR